MNCYFVTEIRVHLFSVSFMLMEGFEPSRPKSLDFESSAYANFATLARIGMVGFEPTIKLSTCKPSQTFILIRGISIIITIPSNGYESYATYKINKGMVINQLHLRPCLPIPSRSEIGWPDYPPCSSLSLLAECTVSPKVLPTFTLPDHCVFGFSLD